MRIFQIYKMELFKMMKAKTNWILMIPSILAIVISFAVRSGVVKLSVEGGKDLTAYSCMDFTIIIWEFISALGIIGIIFILVAAFQFSSEVERGQIKMMILRIGKRSDIIYGKFMAMLTVFVIAIFTFMIVTIASYYIFIANSRFGNAEFALKASGFTAKNVILSVLCAIITFAFLTAVTYCLGCKLNMMLTFVIVLIVMYLGKYAAGLKTIKFMKYTSFYMENQLLDSKHVTNSQTAIFAVITIFAISVLIKVATILFRNTDVK